MHMCCTRVHVGACVCTCTYITEGLMISFTVCNSWCHFFLEEKKIKSGREAALEFLDSETGTHPGHDLSVMGNLISVGCVNCNLPSNTVWDTGVYLLALSPQASLVRMEPLFCPGCLTRSHLPPVTLSIPFVKVYPVVVSPS